MTFARSHRALVTVSALCFLALALPGCGGAQSPEATPPATSADVPEEAVQVEQAAPPPDDAGVKLPADVPMEPLQVSEDFSPTKASGGVEGIPAATNTAPIVAIANFYADLPGFDMSSLTPAQKEKFLQRANSELCTCGCKNDTLAKCYVNDETCTMVRDTLKKVLAEVRAGP